jgi:serine/threonine protein kinase
MRRTTPFKEESIRRYHLFFVFSMQCYSFLLLQLLIHPVILVMEFISGKSLMDMIDHSSIFGKKEEVSPQGAYTLQEIGKCSFNFRFSFNS